MSAMSDRSRVPSGLLGLVSLLGAASGCNEDLCEGQRNFDPPPEPDPGPDAAPTVLAGRWIGAGVLELEFSGPIAALGDLDPQRFALVGWDANAYEYDPDFDAGSCLLQTRYRELGTSYFYYGGPQRGVAAAWIGPEDDTLLRLVLNNTGAACTISPGSLGSGVMLAYTAGDLEGVGTKLETGEGETLADIGPAWAIDRLEACVGYSYCGAVSYFANGHLPLIDSLAEIPCP